MSFFVDPTVAFTVTKKITPTESALEVVKAAYNDLAWQLQNSGRTPVLLEITIRVAPE